MIPAPFQVSMTNPRTADQELISELPTLGQQTRKTDIGTQEQKTN